MFLQQWLVPALLVIAVGAIEPSTVIDVALLVNNVVGETDDIFTCFNLDWWPIDKCDYGNCPWDQKSSIINLDIDNQLLNNAVKAFNGKSILRLGGSLGDFVIYNVTDQASADGFCKYDEFSLPTNTTRIGYDFFSGCLTMDRWDALNRFCIDNDCNIALGLNALYGRNIPYNQCAPDVNCHSNSSQNSCCTNVTGFWDQSQAELLIRYSKHKNYSIYAYEFGNELVGDKGIQSHISVEDYLVDWHTFTSLLNDVYSNNMDEKPYTVVADTTWMSSWYGAFLDALPDDNKPDIVTHHLYSMGPGSDSNVWQYALNVTYLDKVRVLGANENQVVSQYSPSSSIWLGEGGGAYNSGGNNVTNAFNSGFWFLDQIASFAVNGHGAYCRQTLVGGFYSLLDTASFIPNPDYYSLLLFSKLMGKQVISASTKYTESAVSDQLRVYAHCTAPTSSNYKAGSVTVLIINLSNNVAFNVNNIEGSSGKNYLSESDRYEYILSSYYQDADERTLLASRQVMLNGKLLQVVDNEIPSVDGENVSREHKTFVMKPLTYGYIEFPDAGETTLCASA